MKKITTFIIFVTLFFIQTTSLIHSITPQERDERIFELQNKCNPYNQENRDACRKAINEIWKEYYQNPENSDFSDEENESVISSNERNE